MHKEDIFNFYDPDPNGVYRNLIGVVVGATVLIVVPELLRGYSEYRMLLYGCALVAMILIRPRGLIDRRYNPAWLMGALGWR